MKPDKNYIKRQLALNAQILHNYHINRIGIFGSYASGNQKDKSDIDILVDFSQPIDLFAYVNLTDTLSQITGVKVDLVTVNGIKPSLRSKILEEVEWLEEL